MIRPFPIPGPRVQLAYRELNLAVNGTPEQRERIGNPALLPRPWEPASCLDPDLRQELWQWLEHAAAWLNREYTWDVAGTIPTCWPAHPHLVHELAVIVDQRRRAGLALTSDALEEWHRYCLPAFTDRIRTRLKAHCEDEHVAWPGRSRHNQHLSQGDTERRKDTYTADLDTLRHHTHLPPARPPAVPRLGLVDLNTGEVQSLDADDADCSHDDHP